MRLSVQNAEPPPDWWIPEPRPVTKPFRPHHFYAEQRLLLGEDLRRGDTVRFQLPPGLPWVVIDLADFEQVGKPGHKPRGALSVVDFGADRTGHAEASDAFDAAIAAAKAKGRTVFVPAGRYRVNRHIIVDGVTIRGAGNWHTIIGGDGAGTYALQIQVVGAATFSNVDARNLGVAGTWRGDPFDIIDAGGNSGWQNDIHWNWPMDDPRPTAPVTNCHAAAAG